MKYKLTQETLIINNVTLYRIESINDFSNVKKGDKGGFIEKLSNLSQIENAWVYGNACVYGNAWVYENAIINKTSDYHLFYNFGNENRCITYSKSNKLISCGCFLGNLEEFIKKVDLKYKGKGNYYELIKMIEILEL